MSNFTRQNLGDVTDLLDCLHKTPNYKENGIPIVRVTDVKRGYLNLNGTLRISENDYELFSKSYTPKNGDIVFTRVGSCGISALVKNNDIFCLGQNTVLIIPKSIDGNYLFYWLCSPECLSEIESLIGGSTQPTISMASIRKIQVFTPPLPEQQAIAEVLSSLDDKIDLLHQNNKTLEEMADRFFNESCKNNNGEGKLKLKEIIDTTGGYNHKLEELAETGNILLSMGSITKKYGINLEACRYINNPNLGSKLFAEPGDIVITTRDITQDAELLGSPVLITSRSNRKFIVGSNLYKIKLRSKEIDPFWLYFLLRSKNYREYVKEVASGTSILMLKKEDLLNFEFKPPAGNDLNMIKTLHTLCNKIDSNNAQIYTISNMRDTLLPKLMSGLVRVNI
jgi:type I restriction enzyme S subunit